MELVQQLIEHGTAARCTGSTGANAESSRSHAILQLALKRRESEPDADVPVGSLCAIVYRCSSHHPPHDVLVLAAVIHHTVFRHPPHGVLVLATSSTTQFTVIFIHRIV